VFSGCGRCDRATRLTSGWLGRWPRCGRRRSALPRGSRSSKRPNGSAIRPTLSGCARSVAVSSRATLAELFREPRIGRRRQMSAAAHAEEPICAGCGEPLTGRRRHARTHGDACRHRQTRHAVTRAPRTRSSSRIATCRAPPAATVTGTVNEAHRLEERGFASLIGSGSRRARSGRRTSCQTTTRLRAAAASGGHHGADLSGSSSAIRRNASTSLTP
jgi:hypothetical protein